MEHAVRRPVESRRAYAQRRKTLGWVVLLALAVAAALTVLLVGCGGVSSTPPSVTPPPSAVALSIADVQNIVQAAAQAADSISMVIVVVDHGGTPGAGRTATGSFSTSVDVN
jgi:hypothetical protein